LIQGWRLRDARIVGKERLAMTIACNNEQALVKDVIMLDLIAKFLYTSKES
jgi:hypothetical protein